MALNPARQMCVKIGKTVLTPKPLPVIHNEKRRSKGPRLDCMLKVRDIFLRPLQQTAISQGWVKARRAKAVADHIVLRDITLLRPAGSGHKMHEFTKITVTIIFCCDERIGRRRLINWPMGRLQVQG
jgi:hypothetical protein